MIRHGWFFLGVMVLAAAAGGQEAAPTTLPVESPPVPKAFSEIGPLIVHLPGVGGYLWCDRSMLSGLRLGGVDANVAMYDWTDNDPGIPALHAYDRNQKEATRVADLIAAHAKRDPGDPMFITAHSGGCAVAIWTLEKLPANVSVQTVLLMAPALSPDYDLTPALRHVRGKMYAFTSVHDTIVLETGTKVFGTMDGQRVPAAGFSGFVMPDKGDADQYKKLVAEPYQDDWAKYEDFGEHVGAMERPFATAILSPLLGGKGEATTEPSVDASGNVKNAR